MPKIPLRVITFATPSFIQAVQLLRVSSKRYGADSLRVYGPKDLNGTEFQKKNEGILSMPRGAGYWAWKPYIILETLKELPENEVVLYTDAGIEIVGDLTPLVGIAANQDVPVVVSDFMRLNRDWTKRDCFLTMDADRPEIHDAVQVVGGFNLYRNTPKTRAFLEEYLQFIVDDRCNTDSPSKLGQPDLEGFREHRHDQSILSVLTAKNALPIYRDPSRYASQWENYQGDPSTDPEWRSPVSRMQPSPYGVLIDVHRLRNKRPAHMVEMARRTLRHMLRR